MIGRVKFFNVAKQSASCIEAYKSGGIGKRVGNTGFYVGTKA